MKSMDTSPLALCSVWYRKKAAKCRYAVTKENAFYSAECRDSESGKKPAGIDWQLCGWIPVTFSLVSQWPIETPQQVRKRRRC